MEEARDRSQFFLLGDSYLPNPGELPGRILAMSYSPGEQGCLVLGGLYTPGLGKARLRKAKKYFWKTLDTI